MKILLAGDFSGVHLNLKKGLETLGHNVVLASNGDGFKNFESDVKISPYKSKYLGKIFNLIYFILNIRKFLGYDVVQFISPFVFPYYYHFFGLPKLIFLFNKKKIYYACGTDPAYISSESNFLYFPYDKRVSSENPNYNKRNKLKIYESFLKRINYIVPAMYEYSVGYSGDEKIRDPIPLPCSNSYTNVVKKTNKITIVIGITRKNFKGSDIILRAIKTIEQKYKSKVIIRIVSKLPFKEYIKILSEADILIDQCKSYSYGMNAIFGMERGIIVLSGSEKIAMDYIGIKESAVLNIIPSQEQIESVLVSLLDLNENSIHELKLKSLKQVQNIHDRTLVARSFCNFYKSVSMKK